MSLPFNLIVKKEIAGKIRQETGNETVFKIRVTLEHTIRHLVESILLNTEDKEENGNAKFYPRFQINEEDVSELKTLAEILDHDRAFGMVSFSSLKVIFDYSASDETYTRQRRSVIPEFFDVIIRKKDVDRPLFTCRETLFSTLGSIREQTESILKISRENFSLKYKLEFLDDEMTLLRVLGLDVPPLNPVTIIVNEKPGLLLADMDKINLSNLEKIISSDLKHLNVSDLKTNLHDLDSLDTLRANVIKNLSESYTIKLNGNSVELSTIDCILSPEGYLLLNPFAQEMIKRSFGLTELKSLSKKQSTESQGSTPTIGISSPAVDLPSPPSADETVEDIPDPAGTNPRPRQQEENLHFADLAQDIHLQQGQAVPQNDHILQLLAQEIVRNMDEIGHVMVRFALAIALIGPQRVYFLLQRPLIYVLLASALWIWLFFYGDSVSHWIESRLLRNNPANRIDHTIARLVSQVFHLSYSMTALITMILERSYKAVLSKLHYDRGDYFVYNSLFLRLIIACFSVVEFMVVMFTSVFPFLASDTEALCAQQSLNQRQKMQSFISATLARSKDTGQTELRLGFSELNTTVREILSSNINKDDYVKLIKIYARALSV